MRQCAVGAVRILYSHSCPCEDEFRCVEPTYLMGLEEIWFWIFIAEAACSIPNFLSTILTTNSAVFLSLAKIMLRYCLY